MNWMIYIAARFLNSFFHSLRQFFVHSKFATTKKKWFAGSNAQYFSRVCVCELWSVLSSNLIIFFLLHSNFNSKWDVERVVGAFHKCFLYVVTIRVCCCCWIFSWFGAHVIEWLVKYWAEIFEVCGQSNGFSTRKRA